MVLSGLKDIVCDCNCNPVCRPIKKHSSAEKCLETTEATSSHVASSSKVFKIAWYFSRISCI